MSVLTARRLPRESSTLWQVVIVCSASSGPFRVLLECLDPLNRAVQDA